ncbi:MAG: UvrD-helicase domain-containing protein, partial [bacterium]|nr:UvrD-helicase domain-containing protein [bacterium]
MSILLGGGIVFVLMLQKNSLTQEAEKTQLLDELNDPQRAAVTHTAGPLLIVAGAGTGKTTVISRRIAWLVEEGKIRPDEILALTFTDKAAGEMEERVDRLLPYGYTELWISTFHAFAERLLKAHALDIGLPHDFKLFDTTACWMLIRKNLDRFQLNYYRPLGNPAKFIQAMLSHFSRLKDELVTPEQYLAFVEELRLNTDSTLHIAGTPVDPALRSEEISRMSELANAYHTYEQLLLEQNALDFGGLLTRTVTLLKTRPQVRAVYQSKFKYILVDEFQDTNIAQYELVKLLAAPKNNLTVVGDDDQCLPPGAKISTPQGEKNIENIVEGDEVLTAIGKGHVGVSQVRKVMKNKKTARLLHIETDDGSKISVTDNHKMFCYVPPIDDRTYTYVYLMFSSLYGWRIGVSTDLATRLRLERGADKIIGIRSFLDPDEARYFEMLWALTYQIPPVCFKERETVSLKGEWLERLYKTIETDRNAARLAHDLRIDLSSHHYALDSVTRGRGQRVKIHFELCQRNYTSKQKKPALLRNPKIAHSVSLDTSDPEIIRRLKSAGISVQKSKKGIRVRMQSIDVRLLEKFANRLVKITDGFVEYSFKAGRRNRQTLKALAMPAGNLLVGHYVPVRNGARIVYRRIVAIREEMKTETVYDLEIDRTHNFIANNVVVHNSIYKFRGASISNILEFKKDYPDAKEIFLTQNYRSKQNILDLAHIFIQQNNPNRLEVKLGTAGLSKKLAAAQEDPGIISHLHAETAHGEARMVTETIVALKEKEPETTWNDFAVLVRANDHAALFIRSLDEAKIPYELVTARGLYTKPLIMDLVAYLHVLCDSSDNPSLYRVLTSPIVSFGEADVHALLGFARRKSRSLRETLAQASIAGVSQAGISQCSRLLGFLDRHGSLARRTPTSRTVYQILEDTGYLKQLVAEDTEQKRAEIRHLNQFYRKITDFEAQRPGAVLQDFLHDLQLEIDSGEEGTLQADPNEGPESVKILTCHAAKGLEFRYVFVANLVDRRFPTSARGEPIELPDALVKECVQEGDIHLEEERRLFYVACTRAKYGLFFTSANDYGGARKKKLSRFLTELQGLNQITSPSLHAEPQSQPITPPESTDLIQVASVPTLPKYMSYTQLKAFETCPLQYKFAHILKIPVSGRATFSFGRTIHKTLEAFCQLVRERTGAQQGNLFATPQQTPETAENKIPVTFEELVLLYENHWIDDWFESAAQKKSYYEKGKGIL